ncbi:MAG: carbohydrate binding family 9 domain-containing protein [Bacteroidales bacterium]|nr:carbohydrate binding family 9 domain-containing protein [Bacteroidales bacterium]
MHIFKTDEEIEVDGLLDEEIWQVAEKTIQFQRVTPTDTGYAISQTSVMMTYDESNIYIGAVCYDLFPGKRPVQSLRRDFTFWGNDNFAVHIDTYNDYTNGFAFYISPAGVQAEGLISDGDRINWSWDIKWRSGIKSYDDRWVVEYSIPFRSIRYFEGSTEWGINFGRMDLKSNEKSAWAPMPRQFVHADLAYTGTLVWDEPLGKAGLRFSLIPYVKGKVTRDNEADEDTKWSGGAGFDTKIMLSSSMNLDLTVNPDYSQVEEDRQQTNLDRFELFFPERRQFFLENSDLFADLGSSSIRPFFSRRIGLEVPVNAGFRLSGKIGDKWRIGVMDMQTGKEDAIPSANYAVAVLQRQVFSRSNIGGFFINKQVTGDYNDTLYMGFDYNRVAGLEYNLASADNRWTGKAFYHQSFYPGSSADAATVAGDLLFSTRYFDAGLAAAWVGADYVSEVGYIRRTGYFEMSPSTGYTFYPASGIVLSHGPSLSFHILCNPEFEMTDRQTQLGYSIGFQNRSSLSFSASEEFVLLNRPYDPTNTNGVKLAAGESFNWQNAGISYSSDLRKLFTYSMGGTYGSYYNGSRLNLNGSVGYRFQPYGSISVSANYNSISLPDPYNSAELVLIGPQLDITFTDKIFLTTFVQYNNQIENLNTNIRFQWRFAPVSDLYIVYTGNAYTEGFTNKNRGLVVKLSYWFN